MAASQILLINATYIKMKKDIEEIARLVLLLDKLKSKECSMHELEASWIPRNFGQNSLILYYMHKYDYPKAEDWLRSQEALVPKEHFLNNISKNAFAAAVELELYDIAYSIASEDRLAVSFQPLLQLSQRRQYSFINSLANLGVAMPNTGQCPGLTKELQVVPDKALQAPELKVSYAAEFALKNNIPLTKILQGNYTFLYESNEINSHLAKGEEDAAMRLLLESNTAINDESILLAINTDCLKFAVEFTRREIPVKNPLLFSLLFHKISQDSEIGNLDIYLYILRSYMAYMRLEEAIMFADTVDLIVEGGAVTEQLSKLLNPLKFIVQVIELIIGFTTRFDHLTIRLQLLKADLTQLGLAILKEIKLEQQAKFLLFDKDLESRNTLGIILKHNLLEFLNTAIVEKIASEVWYGPYDFAKNPLSLTSNLWEITAQYNLVGETDVEKSVRGHLFAKNIAAMQTHQYGFSTWKTSARLRVFFLAFEYIVLTLGLFISELALRDTLSKMKKLKFTAEAQGLAPKDHPEYYEFAIDVRNWTFWWDIISICILITTVRAIICPLFKFLTRRAQQKFTLEWAINLILFVAILAVLVPFRDEEVLCMRHIQVEGEKIVRLVEGQQDDDPSISIPKAIIAFCLGMRVAYLLRYTSFLGPLITIMESMVRKVVEFGVIFFIVLFVFALTASLLFSPERSGFERVDYIVLTLFQSALAGFSLNPPGNYTTGAKIFLVFFIFVVRIVLLNFAIAMLKDIYSAIASKSNAILYKEVIMLRDQYKPHKVYQFMVSSYFIYDVLLCVMFLPFYPCLQLSTRKSLTILAFYSHMLGMGI
eukprot:TRINITY_DN1873_c0_g1_i1.p1 TRINITY_DN1873_c0_g1~~TRINITY_DN1873_c0_g1_i1.p1  ORF type:complete len:823 (-),score=46.41 TRINITY_DN1873_c0_g1_i1:34-2502(-)